MGVDIADALIIFAWLTFLHCAFFSVAASLTGVLLKAGIE
jgi:hypothetical protein